MRARAQPTSPLWVRTSAQSSAAGGSPGAGACAPESEVCLCDSSSQSLGGAGGTGGGKTAPADFFADVFLGAVIRRTGVGFGIAEGGGVCGVTRCPITSTVAPSAI